jgi:hypothetical protein
MRARVTKLGEAFEEGEEHGVDRVAEEVADLERGLDVHDLGTFRS